MNAPITRLYPAPAQQCPLPGLYFRHDLRALGRPGRPYIYSNFVASLDGRISQPDPRTGRHPPPAAIRHPHDWRLYLELAAQADAVLISGRRLRQLCADNSSELHCVSDLSRGDVAQWRRERGLPPQPACIVLTASLDLPAAALAERAQGELIVISGARPEKNRVTQLEAAGLDLVFTGTARVSGHDVYRVAAERRYSTVYSIAGPEVLYTLVADDRLDRLYLTFALRLVAGRDYDTLLRGDALPRPVAPRLHELYFDPPAGPYPGLLFASLEGEPGHRAEPAILPRNRPY